MGSRYSRPLRYTAAGVLFLTLAAWLVPSFFSAERYRRRLQAELEQTLHRPVAFDSVSFRLLPRPGFSIENAVVREDPSFGAEPFARIDRIDCDLRWRSLWRARLDFARLRLEGASLNVVRSARGEWNVENLLLESGLVLPVGGDGETADPPGALSVAADNARLDFKVEADKKPFAVVGLRARLVFDPLQGVVRFNLAGSPVRTDRALPTPGVVELAGEWVPKKDLEGPLDATLRTRGALLYNWVPLVTGENPDIYGVLDATVHLTGSRRVVKVDGQARLSQLHRWELLP
ncbi:MAG: AsmA family protein, partial [Acidobacteria bacterium]|nr:AsmA family protein [Acidobacteriota bacterium]